MKATRTGKLFREHWDFIFYVGFVVCFGTRSMLHLTGMESRGVERLAFLAFVPFLILAGFGQHRDARTGFGKALVDVFVCLALVICLLAAVV